MSRSNDETSIRTTGPDKAAQSVGTDGSAVWYCPICGRLSAPGNNPCAYCGADRVIKEPTVEERLRTGKLLIPTLRARIAEVEAALAAELEAAWGIIANASEGNWTRESPEWQEAAARWRDRVVPELSARAADRQRAGQELTHEEWEGAYEEVCQANAALRRERDVALDAVRALARIVAAYDAPEVGYGSPRWLREMNTAVAIGRAALAVARS